METNKFWQILCLNKDFFKGWWHLVAFIDNYTHLYEIVKHQLSYMQLYNTQHAYNILQPNMRAHTIITLHTEGDIFLQCQAGNVWIEYTISLIQIWCYAAVFYGVLLRIRNLSPIENSIGDSEIWTPDLMITSLVCYQLSCPDWILIKTNVI